VLASEEHVDDATYGEPRLPLVITLLVATIIPLLLPDELLPGPRWLFPVVIFAMMTAMLTLDPGRIDRRSRQLRRLRVGIALVLAASTTYATLALADALVVGSDAMVNSPGELLRTGGLVWVALRRLSVPGADEQPGAQSDGCHAADALGEAGDGPPINIVAVDPRVGHRPGSEHLSLTGVVR
jgi:hypothetical protein